MPDHSSRPAPGINVHKNGDVKVDPKTASGVNIAGPKVALTAKAIRALYEFSKTATGR